MKTTKNTKTSRDKLQSEATTLYVAGLSVREIARQLNTSPATISRILSQLRPLSRNSTSAVSSSAVSPSAGQREDRGSAVGEGVNTQSPEFRDESLETLNPKHSTLNFPHSQLLSDISTTVAQIIRQISVCTDGETDVAKLATAADKLTGVAERLNNIAQLQQATNTAQGQFTNDFINRHRQHKS